MARRYGTAANAGKTNNFALDRQVDDLCRNFTAYLTEYDDAPPFTDTQASYHITALDLREKLGGAAKSIDSDGYLHVLYFTLEAWGMNSKGAKMQDYAKFAASIRSYKGGIASLENTRLSQIDADIAHKLWRIIQGMRLSQTQSQTVTGAKALHHLLPQLLPPIDREYTQTFFHYDDARFQYNQEEAFKLMLPYFARIAQRVDLPSYVGKARWATSESKLIDNAIIGFCRRHLGLFYKFKARDRLYINGVAVDSKAHIAGCRSCQAVARS